MKNQGYYLIRIVLFLLILFYTDLANAGKAGSSGEVKPKTIKSFFTGTDKIVLSCDTGVIEVSFYSENIVHFRYFPVLSGKAFPSWGILPAVNIINPVAKEDGDLISIHSSKMEVRINKKNCDISYYDNQGNCFLKGQSFSLQEVFVAGENTFKLELSFDAPEDENFYGLGQHQNIGLNLRGKVVQGWHSYEGDKGEIIGFPFMVTNKKYAFLLDNPSRIMTYPAREGKTVWTAEVADYVSFFIIHGDSADDIYKGYRMLTGTTPIPPKSKLGYTQCKTGRPGIDNQADLLKLAVKYRQMNYPCDNLVVDYFHWKVLGDMDFDVKYWPDTKEMNRKLAAMNFNVMISCWPRFMKESENFAVGDKNGYFMKKADGTTLYGTPEDKRGAVADITNPDAAAWFWGLINQNYAKNGFSSYWLDESEPDICPYPYYLYAGSGARIHNIYPYLHAKNVYTGHRSAQSNRCFILLRSAYPGTQQWGTTVWSSDVEPTWDYLKRQIPTGLNFCASGMPYWCSDIGGWQSVEWIKDRPLPSKKLLIKSDIVPKSTISAPDYPELYVRWFQFGAFSPVFRAHGTREDNEVWSYGPDAEKILVKYLRLRYRLLPYIYSQAYKANETGAPFMRALFLDFPDDKNVADITDEYMFGPSFLVAPVVEQGQDVRSVYLPRGNEWYDFWTNKKYSGGQTITVAAPIDRIPLFVKAGTVLSLGPVINYVGEKPEDLEVRIYKGASGSCDIYQDENDNYNYEKGLYTTFTMNWNNSNNTLSLNGQKGDFPGAPKSKTIKVILVSENRTIQEQPSVNPDKTFEYSGKEMTIKF